MKRVNLAKQHPQLSEVIQLAAKEQVLLLTPNGQKFIISEADDFEAEVEPLRNSRRFQRFLDQRMQTSGRILIEEIEAEVDAELRAT